MPRDPDDDEPRGQLIIASEEGDESGDTVVTDEPQSDDQPGEEGEDDKPTGDPLKDTQRKLHSVTSENSKLRERLAKLEGQTEVLMQRGEGKTTEDEPQGPPDPLGDFKEEDANSLLEDPKKLVGLIRTAIKGERSLIARVLQARDGEFLKEIKALMPKDDAKERLLADLRTDPDLKALDDDTLMIVAKKMGRAEVRGGPSGRRGVLQQGSTVSKLADKYEELIYGPKPKDDKR